ncbi:hypothetical protein IJ750_06935 [bacterium]|nr:hypothetical protein [bacterium]
MNILPLNNYSYSRNPSMQGIVHFSTIFSRVFISRILEEGIPCAYTGKKLMPPQNLNQLKREPEEGKILASLQQYKDEFIGKDKRFVGALLEEKYLAPYKNFADCLKIIYDKMVKSYKSVVLIGLDNISTLLKYKGEGDEKELSETISDYLNNAVFGNDQEDSLVLQDMIIKFIKEHAFNDISILNFVKKTLNNISKEKENLDSFKEKFVNVYNADMPIINVMRNITSSYEHIFPRSLNEPDENFKAQILTSYKINHDKGNTLIDDFIIKSEYPVAKNIQNQINRLIEIYKKWQSEDSTELSSKLVLYMFVLEYEFARKSDIIRIDLSKLTELMSPQDIVKLRTRAKNLLDYSLL